MKKAQLPLLAELDLGDNKQSTSSSAKPFLGTDNPRQLRVLHALLVGARTRKEIDRIAGASNGPDVIAALRSRGLNIPCVKIQAIDRDGVAVKFGVYNLTNEDTASVNAWQSLKGGGIF